jgi:hypothetical protein
MNYHTGSYSREAFLGSLPKATIPSGDVPYLCAFYRPHMEGLVFEPVEFVTAVATRLFIEWCGEQQSKGLRADTNGFDTEIFKRFVSDEVHYEYERPRSEPDKGNRGGYYRVRHRILEAFTLNAVDFIRENGGVDGVPGNSRNLRCDLRPYLDQILQAKAA